jgi:hypothetical protein
MPELDVSLDKLAYVIARARDFQAKVAPFDDGDREESEDEPDTILENMPDDPIVDELTEFFRGLNEDEEANLVALAWIGRGTFDADDWDEAMETARSEKTTRTAGYLLTMPLIADFLEDGLDAIGVDVSEVERIIAAGD